jgi:Protein of unknown function (DUF2865)
LRKKVTLAGVAFSALFLAQVSVAAASSVCESLVARLASTTEVIGSNSQSRKFAQAISEQNMQIRKVRGDLRRMGCSSGSVIAVGGASVPQCDELTALMGKMQHNLDMLAARHDALLTTNTAGNTRRRILAAIEVNGCSTDNVSQQQANTGSDAVEIAATATQNIGPNGAEIATEKQFRIVPLGAASEGGSFQTVCVRTCDGGFFPISPGAETRDFRRDARVCEMMCPGVQTELFFKSASASDSENMVSAVSGKAYADMSYAFAYKANVKAPTCGCNFSAYYKEMARREMALNPAMPDKPIVNVQLSDATLKPSMPTEADTSGVKKPISSSTGKIRIVGPQFLPDENTSIDLRHPARP